MSDNNRRVVKSSTNGEETIIEYSDGTKATAFSLPAQNKKETSLSVVGGKTKTGSSSSSSSHSSHSSHSSSSTGGGNQWGTGYSHGSSYQTNKPKKAFEAMGIQFWGTPKYKLDDIIFDENDLIINCTGTVWKPKAKPVPKVFAKESPEWMKLPSILTKPTQEHNFGELASQLLLDWPDMSPPPSAADLDFWGAILDQAIEKGIDRIICCCQAGQGRTGTALSSFLLATGAVDEPDIAIDYIRENYNQKAVETKKQEEYVFGLLYQPVETESKPSTNNKKTL